MPITDEEKIRKRCQDGSVEKYRAPEDHEVVGQNNQGEFADLSPATSRPGEEKVSGTNGTVEMLSARGLALDWAAVFYKTCPARVSFAI